MAVYLEALTLLQAKPGAAGGGQLLVTFVTFGLVFAIMYFLIIRPQSKRQKEQQRMQESLKKGDRVVTSGGVRGTIVGVKEDAVLLKVDDNTKLEVVRSAISGVLERKGKGKGKGKAQAEKDGASDESGEEESESAEEVSS